MEKIQSNFPQSLEYLPRQKSFGCLSLKFGCIFSALVIIVYTILALAQSSAALELLGPGEISWENRENVLMYCFAIAMILSHLVTLVLTTNMLIGTLREKARLMWPWIIWTYCQVMGNLLLIVFWTVINMVSDLKGADKLIVYVISFIGLMVRFYMLTLVSSFYKQLIDESIEERLGLFLEPMSFDTA